MWNLGEYRKRPQRLADYLPWAAFIGPGVVLNKDGSFQKTVGFRGPDLDSSTAYELVAARARMNNVLRRLGCTGACTWKPPVVWHRPIRPATSPAPRLE
jgi:type IV secretion system protein VirB4